jgi:glycosyltransferase involved in cell wall biosynthesis
MTGGGAPAYPTRQLGIRWAFTSFSGWGVFGLSLARDLARRGIAEPVPLYLDGLLAASVADDPLLAPALRRQQEMASRLAGGQTLNLDFPVLHGLGNGLAAGQLSDRVRGQPDIGMVFLESTEPAAAVERAARYRLLLAGSSWNREVLNSFGIQHVAVCPQGVDTAMFRPRPKRGLFAGRFVVFSGGKLELRKGQDIVIAAFRAFRAKHPDALLLTAWGSPFPETAADLANSPHRTGVPAAADNPAAVARWLESNGIPPDSVALLSTLPNDEMAAWLNEADVAIFASRAEGGTNLVAMECLAAGVPSLLSANTGHLDLIRSVPCIALERQSAVPFSRPAATTGWGETDPAEIVGALERIYADSSGARALGAAAAAAMSATWSWSKRIDGILDELDRVSAWTTR